MDTFERPTLDGLLERLKGVGKELPDELRQAILSYGERAIKPLIVMTLDESLLWADQESPEVWVSVHALRLLGELKAAEAVEPFLKLLQYEDDDWLQEELPEFYGKVGEPSLQPLMEYADDRSHGLFPRTTAIEGISKVGQHHPELREKVIGYLMKWLEPLPNETQDDQTFRAFVICELLDLDARKALPAIERAFTQDIVDEDVVTLEYVKESFGLIPKRFEGMDEEEILAKLLKERENQPLSLRLRCLNCGFERHYPVNTVYIDRLEKGEDDVYIRDRIVCRKCGVVNRYELTPEAHLAVIAELIFMPMQGKPSDKERVVVVTFSAFGQPMPLKEAVQRYQREIALHPNDPELRMGYASLLYNLGRYEEALEQYQAARQIEPDGIRAVEALMHIGHIWGELGKVKEARDALRQAFVMLPRFQGKMDDFEREIMRTAVATMLRNLERRGRLDPMPPLLLSEEEEGEDEEAPPPMPVRVTKIGPNEPCPCGSGKKYKKCCGRLMA